MKGGAQVCPQSTSPRSLNQYACWNHGGIKPIPSYPLPPLLHVAAADALIITRHHRALEPGRFGAIPCIGAGGLREGAEGLPGVILGPVPEPLVEEVTEGDGGTSLGQMSEGNKEIVHPTIRVNDE